MAKAACAGAALLVARAGLVAFFRALPQTNPDPEVFRLREAAIRFGNALVLPGTVATVLACLSRLAIVRRLSRGEAPSVAYRPLSATVALLVSVAGLVGPWSLLNR